MQKTRGGSIVGTLNGHHRILYYGPPYGTMQALLPPSQALIRGIKAPYPLPPHPS